MNSPDTAAGRLLSAQRVPTEPQRVPLAAMAERGEPALRRDLRRVLPRATAPGQVVVASFNSSI